MLSVKIIIFIILVRVNVFDAETYEVIDTRQPDPYKITGTWYVVAVISSRTVFPQFHCWTLHISEIYPNSYVGISHFTETVTNKRKSASFRASISDKRKTFIIFDVSLTYENPPIDFKIHHMFMRPNILALSMVGDDAKFFDFLILSVDPILSDNDMEMLRAQIYIDNIKCQSNQRTQKAYAIDSLDLLTTTVAIDPLYETDVIS